MYGSNTDIWLAGGIAAFTVDFIIYPLDTLKTRIQSPRYKELYTDATTGFVKRGLLFRGLYQGIWSVVIATIPSSGAFFTTYEGVKHILNPATKNSDNSLTQGGGDSFLFRNFLPTPVINGIASSIAECVSCFILTPAEVLKQNAQMVVTSTNSDNRKGSSRNPTIQILSKFQAHPTQLWRGYGTLVARNLPSTAIQFPLFEYLREQISVKWSQHQNQNQHISEREKILHRAFITALAAGMAGYAAATITTPIDVVKTRVMLAAADMPASSSSFTAVTSKKMKNANTSAFAVGSEIYRKEGFRGFFKGGAIRASWTALGLGLYLSVYDTGRMYFETRRLGKDKEDAQ